MRRNLRRAFAALAFGLACLAGGCATYGVQERSETAAMIGVLKEELKTPDTVRAEKVR